MDGGFPFDTCSIRCSSMRCKHPFKKSISSVCCRILQVSIFNTLQNNLVRVDFSKVLLDVITIADEVDSQLKQAMLSYTAPGSTWSAA